MLTGVGKGDMDIYGPLMTFDSKNTSEILQTWPGLGEDPSNTKSFCKIPLRSPAVTVTACEEPSGSHQER